MWPISTRLFTLAVLLLLAGCAGNPAREAAAPAAADSAAGRDYASALAALDAGDDLRAEAELQQLAARHPDYAGPTATLGLIKARRGELAAAVALLEQATATCSSCAPVWNELGVLRRQQGQFAAAEAAYRKAIELDPGLADAHFNLAVLHELYLLQPEQALAHYTRYRELGTDAESVAAVDKWIADLRRRTGNVERAAQLESAP
jgi:tetratricopeptide (TPR) repeat protein